MQFMSWDFDAIPASTAYYAQYQMLMEDINEFSDENFGITFAYLVQYILNFKFAPYFSQVICNNIEDLCLIALDKQII